MKVFSFFKILFWFSILCLSLWIGGNIIFNFLGETIELHISIFILIIILLITISNFFQIFFKKIIFFFIGKSKHEKGIENLQLAFSGILIKDKKLTQKNINKAKKYLGNIPIVAWIEGQLLILNKDKHQAKALFYDLCKKEKGTVLGAHGLCKMALDDDSGGDTINAINAILKIYPNAFELIFQAVAINLKNNDFIEAKKHIPAIRKTKKGRIVEAVIYAKEGEVKQDLELMKRTFKLAPELSKNALNYAAILAKRHEYRDARKILLTSFKSNKLKDVYDAYISCCADSNSDKIKLAEKIISSVPENWIVYFGFADLAFNMEMFQIAFINFQKAYNLEQFDFIANMLIRSAKMLEANGSSEVLKILSSPLKSNRVEFIWKCNHCGYEDINYEYICKNCDRIGEYFQIYKMIDLSDNLSHRIIDSLSGKYS